MNLIRKPAVAVLKLFRRLVASSPKLRRLLYEMDNVEEFTNLYEHEKMLADTVRVDTYKKAIQKLIGPDDVVLDLGTGTGILSFFAAQQKPRKIYSIDHSDFINIARETARHNNIDTIEFVQSNSRSFNPGIMADVILHEQIGDYLFNENMIQNILDLKKRLLKPEGRIIPGSFELYLEPARMKEGYNVPFIWENMIYGIDFGFLRNRSEALEKYKPAAYEQEWVNAASVENYLCKASPIAAFDLNKLDSEEEIPHSMEISKQVTIPGTFDGFCLYFKVIFDKDISFETSPLTTHTHWGNCFFRIERRKCKEGEAINFRFEMPDLLDIRTWSVSLQ